MADEENKEQAAEDAAPDPAPDPAADAPAAEEAAAEPAAPEEPAAEATPPAEGAEPAAEPASEPAEPAESSEHPPAEETTALTGEKKFKHGLFGCFDNLGLCVVTYFLPCYTFGKTAEAVGDSCFLCAAASFVPIVNLFAMASVRGKVRQTGKIPGSFIGDLCKVFFCPCCTLVQEAQEVVPPYQMFMNRA